MKQSNLLILFLILMPLVTYSDKVSSEVASNVIYSNLDSETGEWTNMTITSNTYSVSSENILYNKITGAFMFDPWDNLGQKLVENDFFLLDLTVDKPTTIIHVDYLGESNTVSINQEVSGVNSVFRTLDIYFQRVTGLSMELAFWFVDMSIAVLESYPEQYAVSVMVQRANDFLTYVIEEEATLIISDYNIFAQYFVDPNGNVSHIAKKNFSLNSGGNTQIIDFDTFSVGTKFSPSDLYFNVILDNGVYLILEPGNLIPMIGFSNIIISDFTVNNSDNKNTETLTEVSEGLELPLPIYGFIIGLATIVILKKVRK